MGRVLGQAGLSAVAIGGDVSNFLTFVSMGFAGAGQVIIARQIGGQQRERIGRFVGTMSGFLLVCSLVLSGVGLLFQQPILRLMNTPPESWQGALHYATTCMAGLPFIYGYNAVSAILRGMGDSKHPFLFISIAALLNLGLDVLFVAGFSMGAGGAALATVISQGVSFLLCVLFLAKNRREFALDVPLSVFFRWDRALLLELVRLGTPMAIKSASIQVSKLFVNSWINSYGVAVSAFAGIAHKIANVANLISNAMNTAGSTMVGQNIAAGRFDRVKSVMVTIGRITLSIAALLSAGIWLFPEAVFGLFITPGDTEVMALVNGYLPIAALLFFGSAMRSVMNALINGSGNHRINFATAILDGIVFRIGFAVLFGLVLDMKHYGFWLGDALAGFTPFFIGLWFYRSGRWKRGALVGETAKEGQGL